MAGQRFWPALLLLFGSVASQNDGGFRLLSPVAGDTLHAGDTIQFRWEHDRTIGDVIWSASWDGGENYEPLGHVMYVPPDSAFMQIFWGFGAYVDSSVVGDDVAPVARRGGFDWESPEELRGLSDTGVTLVFWMQDFMNAHSWISEEVCRVMPKRSGVRKTAVPLARSGPERGGAKYDLRGRRLSRAHTSVACGLLMQRLPTGGTAVQLHFMKR